jgi:hypothetical protein
LVSLRICKSRELQGKQGKTGDSAALTRRNKTVLSNYLSGDGHALQDAKNK